ncbi:MAG: peptide deformylase [Patescibacteria group bacterium]|nr:peptide deformylase [Patescibacteria group bacterium]
MKIVTIPHPALKKVAKPVSNIDKRVVRLIREMEETLDRQRNPEGVGLSAPQVNVNQRIFIIKNPEDRKLQVFINPEFTAMEYSKTASSAGAAHGEMKDGIESMEGCLSIPGIWANVRRYDKVKLTFQDLNGAYHEEEYTGFMSIVVQHEYDHLNGILFTERALEQGNPLYKEVNGKLREISFL